MDLVSERSHTTILYDWLVGFVVSDRPTNREWAKGCSPILSIADITFKRMKTTSSFVLSVMVIECHIIAYWSELNNTILEEYRMTFCLYR